MINFTCSKEICLFNCPWLQIFYFYFLFRVQLTQCWFLLEMGLSGVMSITSEEVPLPMGTKPAAKHSCKTKSNHQCRAIFKNTQNRMKLNNHLQQHQVCSSPSICIFIGCCDMAECEKLKARQSQGTAQVSWNKPKWCSLYQLEGEYCGTHIPINKQGWYS